ncbi:MAG: hypothetical protein IJJ26_09405 [Victivallales bacterium]|nr:hypothetical protein [Victivallales bacterium]
METKLNATITADVNGFIQAIDAATNAVNNASDNWATRIAVAQNSLTSAAMTASDLRNRLQEAGKETIGSEDHDLLKDQLDETKRAADQALNSISAIFQEISDGASQMGTTAQEFQELQAAASAANVPMEDFADAFEHINTLSRDVANSNEEAKQTFRDLHITQELIQSSSPVEKMKLLQTALEGVADETKKASLANRVFGQSHTQVAALCQGYETAVQNAYQRGAIATQKEIDALRQLQKQAQTSFQTVADASAIAAEKTKSQWDKFKEAVYPLQLPSQILQQLPLVLVCPQHREFSVPQHPGFRQVTSPQTLPQLHPSRTRTDTTRRHDSPDSCFQHRPSSGFRFSLPCSVLLLLANDTTPSASLLCKSRKKHAQTVHTPPKRP